MGQYSPGDGVQYGAADGTEESQGYYLGGGLILTRDGDIKSTSDMPVVGPMGENVIELSDAIPAITNNIIKKLGDKITDKIAKRIAEKVVDILETAAEGAYNALIGVVKDAIEDLNLKEQTYKFLIDNAADIADAIRITLLDAAF